ncbi:hypothetical protein [Alsobacter sp. R-9]
MSKITRKTVGKSINPHLARDFAATTLAVADPRHAHAAGALLGHTSLVTTERHYQQARGLYAQRRYYEELTRLREGEDVTETGTEDGDA